jgi:ATP-dependent RNA helicase DDX19/DBP5
MIHRLNPALRHPQCICLAPTFELAQQIGAVARQMAQFMPDVRIRFATKGEQSKCSMFSFWVLRIEK